jgi:3-hydroxymyristoyl/3-hydroxydecanoyl-(acyl carrier protein) dehydratase
LATVERLIPPDHPAAQGHFPGNPIIPAAVLLSEVIDAVEGALGPVRTPLRIKSVKFPAPTRPGSRVLIDYRRSAAGSIRLVCRVDDRIVLTGEITWDGVPQP